MNFGQRVSKSFQLIRSGPSDAAKRLIADASHRAAAGTGEVALVFERWSRSVFASARLSSPDWQSAQQGYTTGSRTRPRVMATLAIGSEEKPENSVLF